MALAARPSGASIRQRVAIEVISTRAVVASPPTGFGALAVLDIDNDFFQVLPSDSVTASGH